MSSNLLLKDVVSGARLIGPRVLAVPLREQLERALESGSEVVIDFGGVEVTQSFVDELIGVVVLKHGPDLLSRVSFKSCSEDAKAILRFVVSDRADQYGKKTTH